MQILRIGEMHNCVGNAMLEYLPPIMKTMEENNICELMPLAWPVATQLPKNLKGLTRLGILMK
jgi:hypothetical protein